MVKTPTGQKRFKTSKEKLTSSDYQAIADARLSPINVIFRALCISILFMVLGGLCTAYVIYEFWTFRDIINSVIWKFDLHLVWHTLKEDPNYTLLQIILVSGAAFFCAWVMWRNLCRAWSALERI